MKTVVTHNGGFHADDVFAVATLILHYGKENIEVTRTRDIGKIQAADIVLDVGGEYDPKRMRFDHHQEGGAGERENGVPYAAFGLVWKEFGPKICKSASISDGVDKRLVQGIDAGDNGEEVYKLTRKGVYPYLITDAIFSFRPTWGDEGLEYDEGFKEALNLVIPVLKREIKKAASREKLRVIIDKAYKEAKDKRLVVVDSSYAGEYGRLYLSTFAEPLFIVLPVYEEGNWKAASIMANFPSYENRKNFPESWAGKRGKELAEITGVDDAVFCHNKLFVAVAKTKEGAIKLAELAIQSES